MTREEALKKIEELKQFIEQNELKVGDYVEYPENPKIFGVIQKIDKDRCCQINEGSHLWFDIDSLKKITREEYETEKALLADGWIRHTGNECPVDGNVAVEIKCKNPIINNGNTSSEASWYHWGAGEHEATITHYRIVKKKGVEKPKEGDECFSILTNGSGSYPYYWCDSDLDNFRYSQGNVFNTRVEAETYKEKVLDVEGKLRMIANDDPVDWSDSGQVKFRFLFNYYDDELDYASDWGVKIQGATYLTKQGKDIALKEIGEEALEYMIRNKR